MEHKIFYKYNKTIPKRLVNELKEAAESASALDYKMESIHKEVTNIKAAQEEEESLRTLNWNNETFKLPTGLLQSILSSEK